jgi:ABC-2 type transport system permease protein
MLLSKLRLDLMRNRGLWLSSFGVLVALGAGVVLARASLALFRFAPVAQSALWPEFLLSLLCFIVAGLWALWPLLSVGADDFSESMRFSLYPISSFRLLWVSTLARVLEVRNLLLLSPLLGAFWGYVELRGLALFPWPLLLLAATVLFYLALAQVFSNAMLCVLGHWRNAEILGGGLLVFLGLAALIPPVDVSWLLEADFGALEELSDELIVQATAALGRIPTGFLGRGLKQLHDGSAGAEGALAHVLALLELAAVLMVVAWGFLVDFLRRNFRAPPKPKPSKPGELFAKPRSLRGVLLLKEALELWKHPRARLLACVPFVLCIFIRVFSARTLFVYAVGNAADAFLMGALCLYSATLMTSTFAQNSFAYEGHAFFSLSSAPMDMAWVLRAKNIVQALAGALLAALVALFYVGCVGGGLRECVFSAAAVGALLPVLLCAGNFMSLLFPRKFHASLQRKDRLPLPVTLGGIAAAAVGIAPWSWMVSSLQGHRPSGLMCIALSAVTLLCWAAYGVLWPSLTRLLERRKEAIWKAVTRA